MTDPTEVRGTSDDCPTEMSHLSIKVGGMKNITYGSFNKQITEQNMTFWRNMWVGTPKVIVKTWIN